jgi:hypothetical protein
MIDFCNGAIKQHRSAQNERILNVYVNAPAKAASKVIEPILKSEFEEKFPEEEYSIFSLHSLDRFRNDLKASVLEKGEGADNSDQIFQDATKDLKGYLVHGEGKKAVLFVAKKVKA